jgi:hypothetical protein
MTSLVPSGFRYFIAGKGRSQEELPRTRDEELRGGRWDDNAWRYHQYALGRHQNKLSHHNGRISTYS